MILFCFLFSINAQENYSPGYIITNTYDTIRGYIDYKTDIQNAKVCHFKTNLNDEEKSFLPGQIAGYRFTDAGRFYVTKSVKIKDSARTVFLEYLVKGIMNLYYYTEGSDASTDVNYNKYYFFENEKGEMNSITKGPDKIIEIDNGGLKNREDNKYKGMLRYIFRDCEPIGNEALQSKFKQESMVELTKDYHKMVCTSGEECIEFVTKPDTHYYKFNYTIYVASDYCLNYKNDYGNLSSKVENSISPIIGAQINLSIPRWIKSLSLQADVSVTKLADAFGNKRYRYAANLGGKYTAQKMKLRPSIEIGINNEYRNYIGFGNKDIYPGYYTALGLNPSLGNGHYFLLSLGYELQKIWKAESIFSFEETALKLKLGYSF